MNRWIFVIRDDESVFEKRIKNKKWPIYRATKFQTYLKIGDTIIFYQAGLNTQRFLGTAFVNSGIKPMGNGIDSYLDINKIDVWKKRPSIREMITKLSFIKNPKYWGLYVQGGVIKISGKDHSRIIRARTELEKEK